MTTAIQTSSSSQCRSLQGSSRQGSLTQRLSAIRSSSTKITTFVEEASFEIAETFNAIFALLEFESNGTTIVREFIKNDLDASELATIASDLSIETQLDGKPHSRIIDDYLVMSAPLISETQPTGSFSVYVPATDIELQDKLTDSLERTVQWVMEAAKDFRNTAPKAEPPESKTFSTLQKATNFDNLTHLCFGLANNYCEKLGCEKAAIGLLNNDALRIELKAVSGMVQLKTTSPSMIQLQQAQEECLDARHTIYVNADEEASACSNHLIHRRWHQQAAGSSVASVLITQDNKAIGVVSLQRAQSQPFVASELEKVEQSVSNFVPAINLMAKAERSLKQQFLEDYVLAFPQRAFQSWSFSIVAVVTVILLFGWMPYRPTMTCNIQPGNMSRLVAPFDGVLESVERLPGDAVDVGDVVLRFDSRQLETERHGLSSQIKAKSVQRDHALSQRETATAKILDAEIHVLETILSSTNRKIDQCALRSSLKGHVVRGDLRPELGQTIPSGTALAEIAPVGSMNLKIQIPESLATSIHKGATGYFVAQARPGESHAFEIVRITPSTEIVDGKNVIVAEARIADGAAWMRSGMQGYAKIDAGWSPIIWIVGHRLLDSLRLGFWL